MCVMVVMVNAQKTSCMPWGTVVFGVFEQEMVVRDHYHNEMLYSVIVTKRTTNNMENT